MIRTLSLFLIGTCIWFGAAAQKSDPVKWDFSYSKLGGNSYEVKFTATIDSPYHIYSQSSDKLLTQPTLLRMDKNPLITVSSKPARETGKLIRKNDERLHAVYSYYNGKVEFVQVVQLKAKVKTSLKGIVEYLPCTDTHCLRPAETPFDIVIDGTK